MYETEDYVGTLRANMGGHKPIILTREGHRHDPSSETYITHGDIVRRLTPLECERLQGFPDNWTAGHSDTARYRMIGNAVTVNVAEWIGKRIMQIKKLGK